jgi:hypothetical protein
LVIAADPHIAAKRLTHPGPTRRKRAGGRASKYSTRSREHSKGQNA